MNTDQLKIYILTKAQKANTLKQNEVMYCLDMIEESSGAEKKKKTF